jgi:hypothetical protein
MLEGSKRHDVVPAEAGIQFPSSTEIVAGNWIPAFAVMASWKYGGEVSRRLHPHGEFVES